MQQIAGKSFDLDSGHFQEASDCAFILISCYTGYSREAV